MAASFKWRRIYASHSLRQHVLLCAALGLPQRSPGRPMRAQLEAEQDQAWEILRGLGLDPADYFPSDESWLDEYR